VTIILRKRKNVKVTIIVRRMEYLLEGKLQAWEALSYARWWTKSFIILFFLHKPKWYMLTTTVKPLAQGVLKRNTTQSLQGQSAKKW